MDKAQIRTINNFHESDKYRDSIHSLIPGGAHTYSKGDDQFPQRSPAAIVNGNGSQVWDVDGNQYLDCPMGLGSVSLGHAFPPVLEAVSRELSNGVNFQRPSHLEKKMAETFLGMLPQHDMIKFAKNGSSVTTAAVKLARAATGRKLVVFPGNHPFYSYDDWFIGRTDCDRGVPEETASLSKTFKSCNIESLERVFEEYPGQVACVITEPEKSTCTNCSCGSDPKSFLEKAIELTHKHGALFIMDEMVTGLKTGFPGTMAELDLKPDMATWGKGLANGFSFCALTGIKEVMNIGGITKSGEEKVFLISTTHGGETHALAAAMATLNTFQQEGVVMHNQETVRYFNETVTNVLTKTGMQEHIGLIDSHFIPIFQFKDASGEVSNGMRNLMMQEMIARGVLFQGFFCPCYSHTREDIHYFSAALEESLSIYAKALESGYQRFLIGEETKPVFRKYI